ncbi:Flp pilus assembly complex ATPase component TadA [Acidithiobacillus ferrivorans]|nr:Flp pilus assembly complex ATPase component TadA [Acidithiobacillus ferrivorans]
MQTLKEADFSDMYLDSGLKNSRMRRRGDNLLHPLPDEIIEDCKRLLRYIENVPRTETEIKEFSVPYDDVMYRVSIIPDIHGVVYAVRKGSVFIPQLSSCGVDASILDMLLKSTTGLVVIAGSFDTGKTTLASALCLEHSMAGALCITLEDPPELALSGDHGKGRILQVPISRNKIEQAIEDSLRMSFDVLFLSEIRTTGMAQEVVNASANGKRVITTIHADSAINAVTKLISMGEGEGSNAQVFRETLGSTLRAVIYMHKDEQGRRGAKEYLLGCPEVSSQISSGEYKSLQNIVNRIRSQINLGLPVDPTGKIGNGSH